MNGHRVVSEVIFKAGEDLKGFIKSCLESLASLYITAKGLYITSSTRRSLELGEK